MPLDLSQILAGVQAEAERQQKQRVSRAEYLEQLRGLFKAGPSTATPKQPASETTSSPPDDSLAPFEEAPFQQYSFESEPDSYALIAVDGSQVFPDRHKAAFYGVVQAAAFAIYYHRKDTPSGGGQPPATVQARYIPEVELRAGPSPTQVVNRERHHLEMELLKQACLAAHQAGYRPVLLADGMLLPFELLKQNKPSGEAAKLLKPLLELFDAAQTANAILCSYIARPESEALVNMCAPCVATEQPKERHFIPDHKLLEGVLMAGHRTAIMQPTWAVNKPEHLGGQVICACYANFGTGTGINAVIARLEFPQFCANPQTVGKLCGILQRHVRLGSGYPLILISAHEESVIQQGDAQLVAQIVQNALSAEGEFPVSSQKQQAKAQGYSGEW